MKKNLFVAIIAICVSATLSAQNVFLKNDKVLNFGLGLGSNLYIGNYYTTTIPPITSSFEIGILDHLFDDKSAIGVGGYLGYSASKYEYNDDSGYKINTVVVGARGSFHYQFVDKLDTYAGLMLGYKIVSTKDYGNWTGSASTSAALYSYYVGARYYLTDNFAGMLELGYGVSYINIGVALKF